MPKKIILKLPFENRIQAGRLLGQALAGYAKRPDVIVLALPRGGVPVGFEVARMIGAPLDIMLVRKLGTPGQEELAMGAIASGGVCVLNDDIVEALDISQEDIEAAAATERHELERRERAYRGNQPPPPIENHCVILVDDGLATGASMLAAVAALKQQKPASIVVAVPVAPPDTVQRLQEEADAVVCLATPEPFSAVGQWYLDFPQTSDDEVESLLVSAWAMPPTRQKTMTNPASPTSIDVSIAFEGFSLAGFLAVPKHAKGLVVFAHGSGSSRFSGRNRFVAEILNEAGIATLLFDLLTPEEEDIDQSTREFRFDIDLLTERLIGVIDWVSKESATAALPLGLFGASTGAAAALGAAAARADKVAAVVSRGGRPDLALSHLAQVKAPTLLIVGGEDTVVIELNQQAAEQLPVENRLEIIPGATHLFEEAGKLEQVANLACNWFLHYFSGS